ncbi:alkaline phosphatase D family protein [Bernardetia litoralis]|uniref:alkaline phosphatase D family protein n=1 Tax=Bernardetia litoralis TaxID=999 RepID=UPI001FE03277|nr:alkaline phosphatase D family protein [Bernardetia litoralis]
MQSGPMVGYSEMNEIGLWVQTKKSAKVQIGYRPKLEIATNKVISDAPFQFTEAIQTNSVTAFIAKPVLANLDHSTKYEYKLFINDTEIPFDYELKCQTQVLWQYRTDPPKVKFAFGSCVYVNEETADRVGKGYGSEYEIFTSLYKENVDFMIWGGDNTYLRDPDWGSRSGIMHRYTHTRSLPEMQPFLAGVHHYATWDDHDFGPNDSDYTFWNKDITAEAFQLFWASQNTNLIEGANNVVSTFAWADAQFFMLDNRTFRQAQNYKAENKSYFGEKQVQWLIESLVSSKAPFKFVVAGGQILNESAIFENYATYKEERQKVLDAIKEQNIEGVIFLTGDRHHSVITKMERENDYPLYDFTSSSITAGSATPKEDENPTAIKDSFIVGKHNYAVIEIEGKRKERVLTITYKDKDGKDLYSLTLKEDELKRADK